MNQIVSQNTLIALIRASDFGTDIYYYFTHPFHPKKLKLYGIAFLILFAFVTPILTYGL